MAVARRRCVRPGWLACRDDAGGQDDRPGRSACDEERVGSGGRHVKKRGPRGLNVGARSGVCASTAARMSESCPWGQWRSTGGGYPHLGGVDRTSS